MWCLISQPNFVVFEVRCDPKAIGQECLEKVCEYLGISNESDYFGLKYEGSKGEELWLNLRNPIDRQVNCHGHTSPLRLALRVKFWVPPHLLLQETTRHQFYLHARLDLIQKRLLATDWNSVVKLIALIAQAETGDYDALNPPHNVYMQASAIVPTTVDSATTDDKPIDLLQKIIEQHKSYKGMRASAAEYWLLKEITQLESFGEEMFHAKHCGRTIGVGPHGITIYEKEKEKQIIPFTAILSASSKRRVFRLEYLHMEKSMMLLEIKLDTSHAASSLYRAITEKHAFYSCETVRSAVTTQCIRDLKGTIVSIFNEDSTLGKKYVFDIRRTCREVYDNARRALYQQNPNLITGELPKPEISSCQQEGEQCKDSHDHERLNKLLDAMTCGICMDKQVGTAFSPCGHVFACASCAAQCDRCPLCRADIKKSLKIFLPGEFQQQVA